MSWLQRRTTSVLVVVALALLPSLALAQGSTTVELSAGTNAKSANPGQTIEFPFTIKNKLPTSNNVELVPSGPWNLTVTPAWANLSGDASTTATLRVAVPANAPAGDRVVTVVAQTVLGNASTPLTFTVTVVVPTPPAEPVPAPVPDFTIHPASDRGTVRAGETRTFLVFVTMAPFEAAHYTLALTAAAPPGWHATSVSVDPSTSVFYPGDTTPREFRVAVRVPPHAAAGTNHTVTVRAEMLDQADRVRSTSFVVGVEPTPVAPDPEPQPPTGEPTTPTPSGDGDAPGGTPVEPASVDPSQVILSVDPDVLDVVAGQIAYATLTIENPGDAPRTVALSASLDPAWALAFGEPTVTVPAGGRVAVLFSVTAPRDAEPGLVATPVLRADEGATEMTLRVARATGVGDDAGVMESVSAPQGGSPLDRLLADYGTLTVAAAAGAIVAGAGGLALAGSPASRRHFWWIAIGLYTRLTRPRLLDHPERERLHTAIEAQPGIHFHALQRELGWNTGALTYHLRVLERHQLIVSRRDGILRRFYLVGAAPRAMPVAVAPGGIEVSMSGLRGNVLQTVRERGHISQAALAEELGASKQTLNYHVKNLERLGLLRVERVGRDTVLSLLGDAGAAPRGATVPAGLALAEGTYRDEYR